MQDCSRKIHDSVILMSPDVEQKYYRNQPKQVFGML